MKWISKLWCFIHGHDFVDVGRHDNGRSRWGRYECARCDKYVDWQYDYGN